MGIKVKGILKFINYTFNMNQSIFVRFLFHFIRFSYQIQFLSFKSSEFTDLLKHVSLITYYIEVFSEYNYSKHS